MNVSEFSVKNYQFTLVMFLMMLSLGVYCLVTIPKAEDPVFPIPMFFIVGIYPGASPLDVEQLIIDPLEDELNELDNIKSIKTDIDDGLGVIRVEFTSDVDVDKKYEEVLRQVNSVRPKLPSGLLSLDVNKATSENVNIVQFALCSEVASYKDLQAHAERLQTRLEAISALRKVNVHAAPEQEVFIGLNLEKTAQLRIPVNQIIGAIQGNNVNIPAGSVDIGARKYNIKGSGDFASVEQIANTIVGGAQGNVVYLRDVAEVSLRDEDVSYIGRYAGKRGVFVTATMKAGQNIFATRDQIMKLADEFETTLPPAFKLVRGYDQSKNVSHRLSGFVRDFIIAIVLVLVTLLPLGFRAAVIVMISIPLSLAMGLAMLEFTGFSINQLSIVGFVVALGLLVDDSIVVVENIERFLRMGYKPLQAVIAATKQISTAVLGCTATLILAFLPLVFLPGAPGDYIRSLPASVIYTVIASLVVAFTIIPLLSRLILKEESEHGNKVLQWVMHGIERSYGPVLHWTLAHPVVTIVVAIGLFVGSLGLVPVIGFSLFPKAGIPQFLITVETPEGSSLAQTDKAVRHVESCLQAYRLRQREQKSNEQGLESLEKPVVGWFANIGKGNPQIYYNIAPKNEKNNVAEIFVQLHSYEGRSTPAFLDGLREEFSSYAGARIEVKEFENGPVLDAPIAVRVVGDDLDTLKNLAAQVERIMKQTQGTQYVNNPVRISKTDIRVKIDRTKAQMLGVQSSEIDKTLRLAIAGLNVGDYRDESGEEYTITLGLPRLPRGQGTSQQGSGNKGQGSKEQSIFQQTSLKPAERDLADFGKQTLDALDKISVASVTGAQIPLRQLATIEFEASPTTIKHYNKQRAVTITSYVKTGANTDATTKKILADIATLRLPSGYRIIPAGEIESREESFGGIGVAAIVAAFGILAVLVLEFKSFKGTLIVASVIPLGIVGGIAALFLSGNTLSFTAAIGFIALIGIEIKNSILLVDFTNQLREQGMGLNEAIEKAGEIRFFPILLTTLTALGGLIPLALENSALYSPLALVIMGGLVSSTILTRLVTPVMYKLFAPEITTLAVSADE
jgi:multidrug efflux pump subunit AcrB